MQRLTESEHSFYEFLKNNPDLLNKTIANIADMAGKTERRVYQLIAALSYKGYIKNTPEHITKQKIEIL